MFCAAAQGRQSVVTLSPSVSSRWVEDIILDSDFTVRNFFLLKLKAASVQMAWRLCHPSRVPRLFGTKLGMWRSLASTSLRDVILPRAGSLRESAKAYESLAVDVDGGVAVVTLDRPAKHNALNMQLWEEIPNCFEACRSHLFERQNYCLFTELASLYGAMIRHHTKIHLGISFAPEPKSRVNGAGMHHLYNAFTPQSL